MSLTGNKKPIVTFYFFFVLNNFMTKSKLFGFLIIYSFYYGLNLTLKTSNTTLFKNKVL